jgi:flagellar basal body-associated protein FliL
MNQEIDNKDSNALLNRILLCIIAGILVLILIGTIIGLAGKKKQTPELLISQGKAVSLMAPSNTEEVSYFELGTIRISCAAADSEEGGSLMVITPWLAYPAGDTVFYEELSRKSGSIKGIFQAYFSARSKNQLLTETEEHIEAVIKDEINADLALGKISDIYFTDYLFLE